LNAAPPALPAGVSAPGAGLGFSPAAAPQAGAGSVPNALNGDLPLSGPGSRVSPTEFGVPGDEELKHLLSSSSLSHPRPAVLPETGASGPSYYFWRTPGRFLPASMFPLQPIVCIRTKETRYARRSISIRYDVIFRSCRNASTASN